MFWPILISAVTFWGSMLAGAWVLGRRYVRAVEARAALATDITALTERVEQLESEVTRLRALPASTTTPTPDP